MTAPLVLVDDPRPAVRRFTLNRPEKRNAISNALRTELFAGLEAADREDAVRVSIVRGAGPCFSSGYDLASDLAAQQPWYTAGGDGAWSRHVSEGWFRIWDLAKPVIAQVHGYAMAGGSELAAACDLVYVAADAKIGYPVVRMVSPPDMQFHPWLVGMRRAMELLLTGDSISGAEAAESGLANGAFPPEELEARVLELAERIAKIPSDLQQLNKRSVHRAMDVMGARAAIRAGSELQALATHQPSVRKLLENLAANMKQAFDKPS
ncbi:MAG TPA: enoyl-CoA hydratase-related protein [Myxococcota bacterium]|nr:enoyl-CoA hydratase-related protein [Myxococcota bacterium]